MQILPTVRLTLFFITDVECWNGLIYLFFSIDDLFFLLDLFFIAEIHETVKPALHKAADEMKK